MSTWHPALKTFAPTDPNGRLDRRRDHLKAAFNPDRTMAGYTCHLVEDLRDVEDFDAYLSAYLSAHLSAHLSAMEA